MLLQSSYATLALQKSSIPFGFTIAKYCSCNLLLFSSFSESSKVPPKRSSNSHTDSAPLLLLGALSVVKTPTHPQPMVKSDGQMP